jgi:hypothetical protein
MRNGFIVLIAVAILAGSLGCSSSGTTTIDDARALRGSSALNWGSPVVVDNQKWGGNRDASDMVVVNGNPAVAYIVWNAKTSKYNLCYKRASNAAGSSWSGSVKTVLSMPATTGSLNTYSSLAIVNGNPAIAYSDMTGIGSGSPARDLRIVRANDATGSSWGQPVTVVGDGDVFAGVRMIVANGNPAIGFIHAVPTGQRAKYVRALDANGSTWGAPVIPDDTGMSASTRSLAIVNGHPAISYFMFSPVEELRYIRATDATGNNWGSPQTVLSGVRPSSRLTVVNNHPAIIMFSQILNAPSSVSYMRALDPDGSVWPTEPVLLDGGSSYASEACFSTVNGLPAIAYVRAATYAGPYTLSFMRALDADGVSWGSSEALLQLGGTKTSPSLADVAGGAGITYYNSTRAMNFVRGQ